MYQGDVRKEVLVDDDLSWNHVNRLIATRNNKRGSKYLDEQAEMLENELGTDDNEAREMAFKKLVEFASLPEMHEGDKLPEVLLLKLIGALALILDGSLTHTRLLEGRLKTRRLGRRLFSTPPIESSLLNCSLAARAPRASFLERCLQLSNL